MYVGGVPVDCTFSSVW